MADRLTKKKEYKKFVCLGGGIGTSNLIHGLKRYTPHITVVTSMADDGGSSGKLRRVYNMLPPGDLVSCIAALQPENFSAVSQLLTYRFAGNREDDTALDGQKLGNLIMVAAYHITGDFFEALELVKKIFNVSADILPATTEHVQLSGITKDGREVHGETTLDLAKHGEPYGLEKIYITPSHPPVTPKVMKNMNGADVIISGPGDLYTNQLPVIVVPEIAQQLIKSKAKRIFVLNVTNKPFETKGFSLHDFVNAFVSHIGEFPFDYVIANSNMKKNIPGKFKYEYVKIDQQAQNFLPKGCQLIMADIVDDEFPIYHDSEKLATIIMKTI